GPRPPAPPAAGGSPAPDGRSRCRGRGERVAPRRSRGCWRPEAQAVQGLRRSGRERDPGRASSWVSHTWGRFHCKSRTQRLASGRLSAGAGSARSPLRLFFGEAMPGGNDFTTGLLQFAPLLAMLVLFYFLLIRPQQRRMKLHQEAVSAVKRGDTVV